MKNQRFFIYPNHLARLMAHDLNFTHKKCLEITISIIGIIGYKLIQNKRIYLTNFGELKVVKPKMKTANHIITQTVRTFQPRNKIIFKAAPKLKKELKEIDFFATQP